MNDPVARVRKKSRYVAEVRYEAVPQFFDMRGRVLGELHPQIKSVFPHWTSNPGQVLFVDRTENPTAEFVITSKRMALILEDSGPVPSFLDQADKYWKLAFGFLGEWITAYTRVGVRFIEILGTPEYSKTEQVLSALTDKFHRLPGMELNYNDSLVKLVHDQGWWQIGPATADELWVKHVFKAPEENVPPAGFGLDIDSFANDVSVGSLSDATRAVRTVAGLTKSVEENLVKYLGLLDE